jgi:hypothetical protein
MDGFQFELQGKDPNCAARVGRVETPHGGFDTPVFMPVGTQATVKAVSQEDLVALGAGIILGNAYHLYLRPGTEIIERAGGLHAFMSWDRPILTDSGGFQVFSLATMNKVTEDGVKFQSHIDGSSHFFSPESAMDVQRAIGADIIMCFDECTSYPVTEPVARESMERTLAWAQRCKDRWEQAGPNRQALFGIVQGSTFEHLRAESAHALSRSIFPGTPSAASALANPKPKFATRWPPLRRTCPKINRATSWVSARPKIFSMPSNSASTCSIASCLHAMPGTVRCSRGRARSTSRINGFRTTSVRSTRLAAARVCPVQPGLFEPPVPGRRGAVPAAQYFTQPMVYARLSG